MQEQLNLICLLVCNYQSFSFAVLQLSFGAPSPRNYLLTSSHGSFVAKSNDCDAWW